MGDGPVRTARWHAPLRVDTGAPEIAIDGPPEGVCAGSDADDVTVRVRDAWDPAPRIERTHTSASAATCARAVTVTATDACGHVARATRRWYVPTAPETVVDAPRGLVASGSVSWSYADSAACRAGDWARIRRAGGPDTPYANGELLVSPGEHAVEVTTLDCAGGAHVERRFVRINTAPSGRIDGPAVVGEGELARFAPADVRAPEADDAVEGYEWDLDGDGVFDLGMGDPQAVEVTPRDDGVARVGLRIGDRLGASAVISHVYEVRDATPIAVVYAPTEAREGDVWVLSAAESRPGRVGEPIEGYIWALDGTAIDGPRTIVRPASDPRLEVRLPRDGSATVALIALDEDGPSAPVNAQVRVADVDPRVRTVTVLGDVRESLPTRVRIDAIAGAEVEPVASLRVAFGDGHSTTISAAIDEVVHTWSTAGSYTLSIEVFDADSVHRVTMPVRVREHTLAELATLAEMRAPTNEDVARAAARARWGEAHRLRGNTLMALGDIVDAQAMQTMAGALADDTGWLIVRQVHREVSRAHEAATPGHPSLDLAAERLSRVTETVMDPNFADALAGGRAPWSGTDAMAELWRVWFDLEDARLPCRAVALEALRIPEGPEPFDARAAVANRRLDEALTLARFEVQLYLAAGPDAPGYASAFEALAELGLARELAALGVGRECDDRRCATDEEVLDLQLGLRLTSLRLADAHAEGADMRAVQSCLADAARLRADLSTLRVEGVCPRTPIAAHTRRALDRGTRLLAEDRLAAMAYYRSGEVGCAMHGAYQRCLHAALPAINPPRVAPDDCASSGL